MYALRPRPPPPRMRPAAARLVRRPTGRSRGARAYRSRHVSRAVRCPSTCGRSLQSPGSLASTAVVAGVRRCSSGSTMRRSVLRSRRLRRACMARGSTGACSARSQDCVEPRLALWDGLQGRGGPPRVRWRAEYYLCDDCRLSDRVAGGGLARRAAAACSLHLEQYLLARCSYCSRLRGRRWLPHLASAVQACERRVGSPPASPAAGARGVPLVGSAQQAVQGSLPHSERRGAGPRRRRCAANAAAVCVTIASPLCPRRVVDAARRSPLPCPSLPRIINCLRDKSSPNYSSPEVARPQLFINWSRLFTRRSFTVDKSSPN